MPREIISEFGGLYSGGCDRCGPRPPLTAACCLRWRRPPQPPKRPFERRGVHIVEQRREPGLARPVGRVVHPNEMPVQGLPALRLDARARYTGRFVGKVPTILLAVASPEAA
jgi:hypothetical protein